MFNLLKAVVLTIGITALFILFSFISAALSFITAPALIFLLAYMWLEEGEDDSSNKRG